MGALQEENSFADVRARAKSSIGQVYSAELGGGSTMGGQHGTAGAGAAQSVDAALQRQHEAMAAQLVALLDTLARNLERRMATRVAQAELGRSSSAVCDSM